MWSFAALVGSVIILVLWLWEYPQSTTLAAIGTPGMFLGAWAGVLWWRNRINETRLRELAELHRRRDAVTGMWNHHALYELLESKLRQAGEEQAPLSIIRIDIDRFTLFNATHGHVAGDELLRQVGNTIAMLLPPEVTSGRYDSDEFLVILPDTARGQAMTIASHLREKIRQATLAQAASGEAIPVTVSIGVACFPTDATSAQALLAAAADALAVARQNGTGVADTCSNWRTRYRIHTNGGFSTLEAMVIAIDNKDRYTRRHSEEVTEYAQWIAEELGLSEEEKHTLRLAGLVHDVGKIGVPDEVLLKPDMLTAEEYEAMKQHAVLGAVMVAALPGMEQIIPIVRSHHERWDGRGYPDGLAGEQIPFLARVLTVADAFSAMTTDRPYRKGIDWRSALSELQGQKGKQFDPLVVDAFIASINRRGMLSQQQGEEELLAAA
ncbi:MAG: diguanylate cyclase [Armatimonadota bacterium]|nr:diguanylate cyclase [bacterium]MDW8320883.1 diguanylate cyclase [Armatimonadota bacterium]